MTLFDPCTATVFLAMLAALLFHLFSHRRSSTRGRNGQTVPE
jgi:hypothetical protein